MTKYFPLLKHGDLFEVFPGIYEIMGSMKIFGVFRYSRNMHVISSEQGLILVNPVRVSGDLLSELESIGPIKHIYKIGQLHNVDVPFYMDKYKPKLWKNRNDPTLPEYPGDFFFEDYEVLPLCGSKVYSFSGTKLAETAIIHPSFGGTLISCDAYVNMGPDPMANLLTSTLSKLLPSPTYVGPNWVKFAKPSKASLKKILDFEFKNLLTAHGRHIKENAHEELSHYLSK